MVYDNSMKEEEIIAGMAYNRRYVVVNERDVLDTKFCSVTEFLRRQHGQVATLAAALVVTRYPSAQREDEMSRKIKEYEISDLGIDHAQYFPGFGVYGTSYDAAFTGIGETLADALDDAMAQLAMSDVDVSKIEEESDALFGFSRADSERPLHDETDECQSGDDGCEHHHYVGIRVEFVPDKTADLCEAASALTREMRSYDLHAFPERTMRHVAALESAVKAVEEQADA